MSNNDWSHTDALAAKGDRLLEGRKADPERAHLRMGEDSDWVYGELEQLVEAAGKSPEKLGEILALVDREEEREAAESGNLAQLLEEREAQRKRWRELVGKGLTDDGLPRPDEPE